MRQTMQAQRAGARCGGPLRARSSLRQGTYNRTPTSLHEDAEEQRPEVPAGDDRRDRFDEEHARWLVLACTSVQAARKSHSLRDRSVLFLPGFLGVGVAWDVGHGVEWKEGWLRWERAGVSRSLTRDILYKRRGRRPSWRVLASRLAGQTWSILDAFRYSPSIERRVI